MRRPRWLWLLAALISVSMLTFAACGGDDDDDGDEPSGGDTPAAGETTTTGDGGGEYQYVLTEAPADAAPPEDQKLRVNLRGEPDTIDPQKSNFADNIT